MEVRWTSMPPNGCAVDRRTPGTKEDVARAAREPFKVWIPACAGMTTGLFGGLWQESPNFRPGVQQNPLHPFGGVNTR
jgi:hypothetical protein